MQSKLLKQLIILIAAIHTIILITGYSFEILTNKPPKSPQIQLINNVMKFAIIFGVGSSIILSTKVFLKHSVENIKKIEESDESQN